ncbi:MAG: FlgD immunoglobulin-like domain containing protein [Candidatus Latescibacterota bacterium]
MAWAASAGAPAGGLLTVETAPGVTGVRLESALLDDAPALLEQAQPVQDPPAGPARSGLAMGYRLQGIWPNPFNGATEVRFALPGPGSVRLRVDSAGGQRVRTLADGAHAAGVHTVAWAGRDEAGRDAATGLYLCRLEAGAQAWAGKLMLVR